MNEDFKPNCVEAEECCTNFVKNSLGCGESNSTKNIYCLTETALTAIFGVAVQFSNVFVAPLICSASSMCVQIICKISKKFDDLGVDSKISDTQQNPVVCNQPKSIACKESSNSKISDTQQNPVVFNQLSSTFPTIVTNLSLSNNSSNVKTCI